MPIDVTMPKLTDTMEAGTIVRWLKRVGEQVSTGEILAEVETDKADMELEAVNDGVVGEIKVGEGDTAPVGAVIAVLIAPDDITPTAQGEAPTAAGTRRPGSGVATAKPAVPPVAATKPLSRTLVATPLARRTARLADVDMTGVTGSGPHGRVTKRDVDGAAITPARGAFTAPPAPATPATARIELSKMRQTIARRMSEAMRDIPHFYVTAEIDMSQAMALRESLEKTGVVGESATVTHLLIKAVAVALRRHPRVNAAWDDGGLRFSEAINIGIATAVEDGLLVPVLQGCERLSLMEITAAARALREKARGGLFAPSEMLGGTFTISNLGMHDVEEFTAIINPPQAAILAVGAIKERPIVRGGRLVVGQTMRVTLSCDHRILNGVEAARFLEEVKLLLENPVALVVS